MVSPCILGRLLLVPSVSGPDTPWRFSLFAFLVWLGWVGSWPGRWRPQLFDQWHLSFSGQDSADERPTCHPFQQRHLLLLSPLQHGPGDWPLPSLWTGTSRVRFSGSKQNVAIVSMLHITLWTWNLLGGWINLFQGLLKSLHSHLGLSRPLLPNRSCTNHPVEQKVQAQLRAASLFQLLEHVLDVLGLQATVHSLDLLSPLSPTQSPAEFHKMASPNPSLLSICGRGKAATQHPPQAFGAHNDCLHIQEIKKK